MCENFILNLDCVNFLARMISKHCIEDKIEIALIKSQIIIPSLLSDKAKQSYKYKLPNRPEDG